MKWFKQLKLIHWLLLTTFFKQVVFMLVVPMWHGPDEQAHFAQVQFLAEYKRQFPNAHAFLTTSQEILLSERLLGTERDSLGKNRFTHHPDYRIEYTSTTQGKYEQIMRQLTPLNRTTLVKKEATEYPPLFYIISAFFYYLLYPLSLIERLFITRLASVLMGLGVVWFSYKIAQVAFPVSNLKATTVALLVSFQPMFSFLTATINSDNLMNLIFTILIYLCVKSISSQAITKSTIVGLGLSLGAGFLTKPHFITAVPLLFVLPLFLKISAPSTKHSRRLIIAAGIALVAFLLWQFRQLISAALTGQTVAFAEVSLQSLAQPARSTSLWEHARWTLRHTIAEVIPWYWGVFNWLGVVLPRTVNRILNRALILAVFGLGVWLWRQRRKPLTPSIKAMFFLGLSTVVFFITLFLWDWLFVRTHGYSFGMQGRYYFPTLSAHMTLLFLGLSNLLPASWKLVHNLWVKFLGLSSIGLNFVGLYTIAAAYYQLWPPLILWRQLSQYKPLWFKFPYVLIWFTLYGVALTIFLAKYLVYAHRPRSRT